MSPVLQTLCKRCLLCILRLRTEFPLVTFLYLSEDKGKDRRHTSRQAETGQMGERVSSNNGKGRLGARRQGPGQRNSTHVGPGRRLREAYMGRGCVHQQLLPFFYSLNPGVLGCWTARTKHHTLGTTHRTFILSTPEARSLTLR